METDKNDLTRQDEEISAQEFEAEEKRDRHDFGNWPDAVGLVATGIVIWLIFAFTG